jgi:hypothetical protein
MPLGKDIVLLFTEHRFNLTTFWSSLKIFEGEKDTLHTPNEILEGATVLSPLPPPPPDIPVLLLCA